jgi:hypothetical protein
MRAGVLDIYAKRDLPARGGGRKTVLGKSLKTLCFQGAA